MALDSEAKLKFLGSMELHARRRWLAQNLTFKQPGYLEVEGMVKSLNA